MVSRTRLLTGKNDSTPVVRVDTSVGAVLTQFGVGAVPTVGHAFNHVHAGQVVHNPSLEDEPFQRQLLVGGTAGQRG